ncbi:MAG: HAD family hydrolase [Anaerolineaceae bacterium]|jgi:HAD superfamily hydrolase (TIGR01509 family)
MALDLSRVRGLCFDVDGNLSDTDDTWVDQFEKLLSPLRGLFPQRDVRAFARWAVMSLETPGNLVYHLLDRAGLDRWVAGVFNLLAKRQHSSRPRRFLMVSGVDRMLPALKAHYPMAIVSARDERTTLAFLERFQLLPLFDAIATAHTCRYTKPYPDPIRFVAEAMGVQPAECLMIGDTTVDMRAGKAAGAQTVGVLCGFGHKDELVRAGADLVLASTADLLPLLLAQAHRPGDAKPGESS